MTNILGQVDKDNDKSVEREELMAAFGPAGVLENIDTDSNLKVKLEQELGTVDETIKMSRKNNLQQWTKEIEAKNPTNRTSLENKVLLYISTQNYSDARESVEFTNGSTRDIIQQTKLQDKVSLELSHKLDATRFIFLKGYFPNIDKETLKQLSVGVSFAFMDRYSKHKKPATSPTDPSDKKPPLSSPIAKTTSFLDKFTGIVDQAMPYAESVTDMMSGQGMGMIRGVVGMLGTVGDDIPLQKFFTKIQNAVTILKTNKNKISDVTNAQSFVEFFRTVDDTKFLKSKETRAYFDDKDIANLSGTEKVEFLKKIANNQAKVMDDKTTALLNKVVDNGPKVLAMRNVGRSGLMGLYDQLQGIFSKVGGVLKTLGMDFGSVDSFLRGIPGVDLIMAVLGFNGVDGFIQEYRTEKIGVIPESHQKAMDYAGSFYQKYQENTEGLTYLDAEGKETEKSSMNLSKTQLGGNGAFLHKLGREKRDSKEQVAVLPKLPLNYALVGKSVQQGLTQAKLSANNLPDKVDEGIFKEVSVTLLADTDFLDKIATNKKFSQADFVAALMGAYLVRVTPTPTDKKPDPSAIAKGIAVGAVGYTTVNTETQVNENLEEGGEEGEIDDGDTEYTKPLPEGLVFREGADMNSEDGLKKVKYITKMYAGAYGAGKALGISVAAILAQKILETGRGEDEGELSLHYNNHGGVKFSDADSANRKMINKGLKFKTEAPLDGQKKLMLKQLGIKFLNKNYVVEQDKYGSTVAKKDGKISAVMKRTSEVIKGKSINVPQRFRVYDSVEDYFAADDGYVSVISQPRYMDKFKNLTKEQKQNPKNVCQVFQDGKYATAENYADTLMDVVKTLNKYIDIESLKDKNMTT